MIMSVAVVVFLSLHISPCTLLVQGVSRRSSRPRNPGFCSLSYRGRHVSGIVSDRLVSPQHRIVHAAPSPLVPLPRQLLCNASASTTADARPSSSSPSSCPPPSPTVLPNPAPTPPPPPPPEIPLLLPRLNISSEMSIKSLALDRHVDLVKGILHDVVGVELVHPTDDDVDVGLVRLGEEQELGAGQRLETLQPEMLRLEHLQPRRRPSAWRLRWVETRRYGVDSVCFGGKIVRIFSYLSEGSG